MAPKANRSRRGFRRAAWVALAAVCALFGAVVACGTDDAAVPDVVAPDLFVIVDTSRPAPDIVPDLVDVAVADAAEVADEDTVLPPPVTSAFALWAESVVDDFKALHAGLVVPDHLLHEKAPRDGTEFDVALYFGVFQHIRMRDGFVLDWVYLWDGAARVPLGYPVLYSRRSAAEPFRTHRQLTNALALTGAEVELDYRNNVVLDGSPESFFEYAVLLTVGDQFYQHAQARYLDTAYICTRERLALVLAGQRHAILDLGERLPDDVATAATAGFVEAHVVAEGGDVTRVVTTMFTNWGGFVGYDLALSTTPPHTVLANDRQSIAAWNCGVRY